MGHTDLSDRYGTDVLAGDWRARGRRVVPDVPADHDLVVEVSADGFCGAVTRVSRSTVELEDARGARRVFPLGSGFMIDGQPVSLIRPPTEAGPRTKTASGSFAAADDRAWVARASRILVEGKHDAELVERVWGDDLRAEGVVVEMLDGLDLLSEVLRDAPPSSERRYGVLADHLVPGSKESRIAEEAMRGPNAAHIRIVGHPFVDIWQCVKPSAVGIRRWPVVGRGVDWKTGVCRGLGWPAETPADLATAWRRILARVRSYRDLEPALIGRVEELIDFVTEPL